MLSSCNATKYLKENEYLYKKSEITFTEIAPAGIDTNAISDELLDLNKLKRNEKVFGVFPLKTSLYVMGDRGIDSYINYQDKYDTRFLFVFDYDTLLRKIPPIANYNSKFRIWLRTKAGRQPQMIDSVLIDETNTRISNYLFNRGYFNASSQFTIGFNPDKKNATVFYHVHLGNLYRMRTINYVISDKLLAKRIQQNQQKSTLYPGQPFDVNLLTAERTRITEHLRNSGYYKFQKEYIYFEVDSTTGEDSLDIDVKISMPAGDSVHHPYKIKSIYVYPNADADFNQVTDPEKVFHYIDSTKIRRIDKQKVLNIYLFADTTAAAKQFREQPKEKKFTREEEQLLKSYVAGDTSATAVFYLNSNGALKKVKRKKLRSDFYFVGNKRRYNQGSIGDNIFVNPDTYYSDSLIQKTVQAFSNVGIFKFVTIQAIDVADSTTYMRYLNLIIKLEPAPAKTFTAELNTNTTAELLLGNAVDFSYIQRNLFHQLDQVKFNIKGGIETQLAGEETFINTSELNTGLNLTIPKLGWPFQVQVPKRYYPQTTVAVNFNYINQITDFTLYNTSFEYSISVYENTRKKQHIFKFPIPSVNIVQVPRISAAFNEELNQNQLLRQSFDEVIIVGYGYTFIFNSQAEGSKFYDKYLRASAEINAPFADFFRVDADFRNYLNFNPSNQLVLRVSSGFADPWDFGDSTINTTVIPYVKEFFAGGAYSVRAFPIRKIGPGSYINYDTITGLRVDQVADMKLELNIEYRFDIFTPFEGALFCDFGNTWTLKEDQYREHAQISWDFLKQIAVGPGAGIRLDLSYFIIRFDMAYPLYDPALDGPYGDEYRAYYESVGFEIPKKQVTFNLAIGYPF